MQDFNSNNLYPYLLQLKINEFNDFKKVKKTFQKLSNKKDFDIRIKEIEEYSNNDKIFPLLQPSTLDAQVNRNPNSVDVSIIDHKLKLELYFKDDDDSEEYPFEFSPAGYYEMLCFQP